MPYKTKKIRFIILQIILLSFPMGMSFSVNSDFDTLRNLITDESYESAKKMIQQGKGVEEYSEYETDTSPLSLAIEKGQIDLIQEMLLQQVPINQLLHAGLGGFIGNALTIAVQYKQLEISKLLIQNDIEILDLYYPLLYQALLNNDYTMADYLVSLNHPTINSEKNIYQTTGLLVKAMNKKGLKYIQKKYNVKLDMTYDNKTLFWVITDTSEDYYPQLNLDTTLASFKFLIKNGADIHHTNNQGENVSADIVSKILVPQNKIDSFFKFLATQEVSTNLINNRLIKK